MLLVTKESVPQPCVLQCFMQMSSSRKWSLCPRTVILSLLFPIIFGRAETVANFSNSPFLIDSGQVRSSHKWSSWPRKLALSLLFLMNFSRVETLTNQYKTTCFNLFRTDEKLSQMNFVTKESRSEFDFSNNFTKLRDSRDAACDQVKSSKTYIVATIWGR